MPYLGFNEKDHSSANDSISEDLSYENHISSQNISNQLVETWLDIRLELSFEHLDSQSLKRFISYDCVEHKPDGDLIG